LLSFFLAVTATPPTVKTPKATRIAAEPSKPVLGEVVAGLAEPEEPEEPDGVEALAGLIFPVGTVALGLSTAAAENALQVKTTAAVKAKNNLFIISYLLYNKKVCMCLKKHCTFVDISL
jgi:hypothetical protein